MSEAKHTDCFDEVFDALKGMVNMWETVCMVSQWDPDHLSQYRIAKSAIAKAEGRSQGGEDE